jgi:hypothetical protein
LFRDPSRIGFREHWLNLVREAGYRIAGHELVPLANDETPEDASQRDIGGMSIARHRTRGSRCPDPATAVAGRAGPRERRLVF